MPLHFVASFSRLPHGALGPVIEKAGKCPKDHLAPILGEADIAKAARNAQAHMRLEVTY